MAMPLFSTTTTSAGNTTMRSSTSTKTTTVMVPDAAPEDDRSTDSMKLSESHCHDRAMEAGTRPRKEDALALSDSTFVQEVKEGLEQLREGDESINHNRRRRRLTLSRGSKTKKQAPPQEPPQQLHTFGMFHDDGSSHKSSSMKFDKYNDDDDDSSSSTTTACSKWLLTALIVLLGAAASASFIAFGLHATNIDMAGRFESSAEGIVYHVLSSWTTYEMFGLWIHESCHRRVGADPNIDPNQDLARHLGYCSRQEFRRLFEYIQSQGVDFLSAQYARNITHEYREALEEEGREYYSANYPTVNYRGITEMVASPQGGFELQYRSQQDYYMPIHYVEPVVGNELPIELDKLASVTSNNVITAMENYIPVLSPRLKLVQEKEHNAYGVILAHPGVPTSIENVTRTNAVSQIVVRVPSFLEYALKSAVEDQTVYLYDSTTSQEQPDFLGAVEVEARRDTNKYTSLPEIALTEIPQPKQSRHFQQELNVAGRQWTMVMVSTKHQADLLFVILGGTIIFAASLFCAAWFHSHLSRVTKLNKIKSAAEAEKAEIARIQAQRESALNEFVAHEVRNPLSSAISALSFVSVGVAEYVPNPVHKKSILDDVGIMDASLQFINELLRNMLDIHRARSRQIKLNLSPTDIRRDILEPVAAILFMRGAKVAIEIDCPQDLAVQGDRMRLKQIMLNLSANATKFVQQGYIRIKAATVNGSVELYVEDSGPGIPLQKRNRLFAKFQESLDSLNQGTGIGLAVCKNLCELMGADIWLDETFHSGVKDCPGTRFVLRLNQPSLEMEKSLPPPEQCHGQQQQQLEDESAPDQRQPQQKISDGEAAAAAMVVGGQNAISSIELPDTLSILVVDDDTMIRKMFKRAALRVAPKWEIEEASNGETALCITEKRQFDVIFLDQYMASVEKQLLGTETARALRSKGVESIICGLSANDMAAQFLESGADTFMIKPFPCKKDAMTQALNEILVNGRTYKKEESLVFEAPGE